MHPHLTLLDDAASIACARRRSSCSATSASPSRAPSHAPSCATPGLASTTSPASCGSRPPSLRRPSPRRLARSSSGPGTASRPALDGNDLSHARRYRRLRLDHRTFDRRQATLDDLRAAALVGDALDEVALTWYAVNPSGSVEPRLEGVLSSHTLLTASGKHAQGAVLRQIDVPYVMELAGARLAGRALGPCPSGVLGDLLPGLAAAARGRCGRGGDGARAAARAAERVRAAAGRRHRPGDPRGRDRADQRRGALQPRSLPARRARLPAGLRRQRRAHGHALGELRGGVAGEHAHEPDAHRARPLVRAADPHRGFLDRRLDRPGRASAPSRP